MPAARGKTTLSPGVIACTSSPTATTIPDRTEISDEAGNDEPGPRLVVVVRRLDHEVVVERLDTGRLALRAREAIEGVVFTEHPRQDSRCTPIDFAPMDSAAIRRSFVEHFVERGHIEVPSASLVPATLDPSVLLTTAGMQPFKPFFRGDAPPPAPRLTSVQKCFRAVDIDEVGKTARHLTFFEMMGNFSFGDYFKEGAVELAWDLSLGAWGLDRDRIWATVYRGSDDIPPDDEARQIWLARGVPAERIVALGDDNFWAAGPTGPVRPVLRAVLRPRRRARLRPARLRARLLVRPVPRVLEPRLHAVRPRRRRAAHAAAEAEHRHRGGPRARRSAAAGRPLRVRGRRLPRHHLGRRGLDGRALHERGRRAEGACACWPTTAAR